MRFSRCSPASTFYDRPIPERHRLIFYLGHLEAFDRNLLSGALESRRKTARSISCLRSENDPVGGGLPADKPGDWPSLAQVEQYKRDVRVKLDERLREPGSSLGADPLLADGTLLNVAIEHRLMHEETLAYLLHNLPHARKIAQKLPARDSRPAPYASTVTIPSGIATLGQPRAAKSFGWDNEFGAQRVLVPGFRLTSSR